MSTRSGKRIHGSFHENDTKEDVDHGLKSERKSRRKRSKENVDECNISVMKPKKRVNYVTYPTDDEMVGDMTVTNEDEGRTTRSLRKNALKENNDKDTDHTDSSDTKKVKKNTRRTKKFAENDADDLLEATVNVFEKKKGKKQKVVSDQAIGSPEPAPKRKTKRKKKKSSIIVEDISEPKNATTLNKSNMSVDSFHSAAGSPVKCNGNNNEMGNETQDECAESNVDHISKYPSLKLDETSQNEITKTISPNNDMVRKSMRRKSMPVEEVAKPAVNSATKKPNDQETLESPLIMINSDKKTKRKKSLVLVDNPEPIVCNISDNTSQTENNMNSSNDKHDIQEVIEKPVSAKKRKSVSKTFEDLEASTRELSNRKSSLKVNISLSSSASTFNASEKDQMQAATRKSSIIEPTEVNNSTFDKNEISLSKVINSTFDRLSVGLNNTYDTKKTNSIDGSALKFNSTYDKVPKTSINTTFELKSDTLNNTYDKTKSETETVALDHTFDKATPKSLDSKSDLTFDKESKSSLLTDDTDKDMSHVSLTSDESQDNIINTTPVLIESSFDNTQLDITKTESPKPTPLKREGTFTKESSDVSLEKTPQKRFSLPSPGFTPFHASMNKSRPILNVTRSIEKVRESSADVAPKSTKVMFCSPVNNPVVVVQQKRKVIKSNLKGSNKSFVFEDNERSRPAARKRSYTLNDAEEAGVKRKRLVDDMQQSVDRLSRPRTSSATAKLEPVTPKPVTPCKAKPSRTKLPNFAALHQKQFDKMESLDECQERKAKRAKKLLTPTGLVDKSARGPTVTDAPEPKVDTPTKLPTLDSLKTGYTRFGFKLNMDVNPFSIPGKNTEVKPKENRPNGLRRQATLPSLAGATSLRREAAKQIVLREKSFTDKRSVKRNEKRSENRTIIKGVRTNRRFELQMKMRNID